MQFAVVNRYTYCYLIFLSIESCLLCGCGQPMTAFVFENAQLVFINKIYC